MIPYSRHSIDDDDIGAVVEVLRGDWLTTGPAVVNFEKALADYVGAEHAVAVSSGTAALHAALYAAEINGGDVVGTTPISFSASANAARYRGTHVVFSDIDRNTMNLDPNLVPEVDALVAVHFSGLPFDLRMLQRHPRVIIEDAAQALGASTPDGPVGNCARSHMTTFSFHPVKSITTGEGGAVTTNDRRLAERLRQFRSHGMIPTPEHGGWSYDIESIGFNYRLTDMQAALGTSQLTKLDRFIERRNDLAAVYDKQLASLPIELPPSPPAGTRHARHLYVIRVHERRAVYDAMRAAGVGVQVHHMPIPGLTAYGALGADMADYPVAAEYYDHALSLPLFPDLTEREQHHVVESLAAALRR